MNSDGHRHIQEIEKRRTGYRWRVGLEFPEKGLAWWMRWHWAPTQRVAQWAINRWGAPEKHKHDDHRPATEADYAAMRQYMRRNPGAGIDQR